MVSSKLRASLALLSATTVSMVHASSHMIMGGLQPIAYERVDPIVNPGGVASHVHAIFGANNLDQNSNYDSLRDATCTSVPFQTVDKSSYWMPVPYYQDQNTHALTMLPVNTNIYYFFDRNGPGETVHAFPKGLRMVAGSPTRGTYNATNHADQAVSFVCLDYSGTVSNDPAYAERQDINFPDPGKCEDGIRYQVFFPMCWDGVNLDSADHKSHMAYPVDSYNSGTCPSSHPVHLVGLFFEMIVPMNNNYWGQGAIVLSSGDPTGLAFHGDFMNGWDIDMLQNAVDNCHNMNGDINACQVLAPSIDQNAAHACTFAADVVNENVQGPLVKLPGCNPIQVPTGSTPTCPNAAPAPAFQSTGEPLATGWTDVGCIVEASNGRALTGASTTSPQMSLNFCANFCQSKGFSLAGVEFGDECYCGNSFSNGATGNVVSWDQCTTPCASNPTYSKCGGPQRLELLKFAPGSAPATSKAPAAPTTVAAPVTPSVMSTVVIPVTPSAVSTSAAPVKSSSSSIVAAPSVSSVKPSPIATTSQVLVQQSSSAAAPANTPSSVSMNGWVAAGCANDGSARALTGYHVSDSAMTNEKCISTCASKGFTMAGTEYSTECYCGNSFSNGLGQLKGDSACYMSCGGDNSSKCGGTWSLNMYKAPSGSAPAAPPQNTAIAIPPSTSGTWVAAGCVNDGSTRALAGASFSDANMTTAKCTSFCSGKGFTMAGTEYSTECYCGNSFSNGLGQLKGDSACYMSCGGDHSSKCGGTWSLNLMKLQTSSKRSKHFGRQAHYRGQQF